MRRPYSETYEVKAVFPESEIDFGSDSRYNPSNCGGYLFEHTITNSDTGVQLDSSQAASLVTYQFADPDHSFSIAAASDTLIGMYDLKVQVRY